MTTAQQLRFRAVMNGIKAPCVVQGSEVAINSQHEGLFKSGPTTAGTDLADTAVRVALRARPLVARERLENCKPCITVNEASGLVALGKQRQFVFDQAFGPHTPQEQVYSSCVSDLVDAVMEGYNATVLAYGPTGSGKTYTMGTGSALHCRPEQQGIIPRVIKQICDVIKQADSSRSFVVRAQFLEIYNEEVRDLLTPAGSSAMQRSSSIGGPGGTSSFLCCSTSPEKQRANIAIRECPDGQIIVTGAREEVANCYEDLVHLLDVGALNRATGATALNEQSSRSHAIFTIIVEQSIQIHHQDQEQQQVSSNSASSCGNSSGGAELGGSPLTPRARLLQQLNSGSSGGGADPAGAVECSLSPRQQNGSHSKGGSNSSSVSAIDSQGGIWPEGYGTQEQVEYRCAKFHLVDLAGSERTKQTGAVGARFKETVTINQGLLALGNVISALGDEKRRPGGHVPYRDSKLTRLLQDSLGGNSKTLMIACISSADNVLEDNLNTLKYASRARRIRNMPVVNRQQLGSTPASMTANIEALQLLLLRRYAQHVLGAVTAEALPPLLLTDASRCSEDTAVQMLRELQALAAVPPEPLGLMLRISKHGQEQTQHVQQLQALNQQAADLQAQLLSVQPQAQLQASAGNGDKVMQLVQTMNAAKQQLLQEIEQMHSRGQISKAVRKQLAQLLDQQLPQPDALARSEHNCSESMALHSHPLPAKDASCSSEAAEDAIGPAAAIVETAAAATAGAEALGVYEDAQLQQGLQQRHQIEQLQQELAEVQTQLEVTSSQLHSAQMDLARDEEIFAERVQEMSNLRSELAAVQDQQHKAQEQMQQLRADLRRWRALAMSMQDSASLESQFSSPICNNPASPSGVQASNSPAAEVRSSAAGTNTAAHGCHTAADHAKDSASCEVDAVAQEDQVLYDRDLASYISETDYTAFDSMAYEDDNHLLAELQVVLADKAALEEEKAAAEVEAAAAQRSFERSHMLLEGQLNNLAAAIASQEMLISTLQSNEAEARQMGALYLDRCRELETEIAELNIEMEELTAALARVEADAAASAEEKARLRSEYETRIQEVVKQMSGLQKQLKGQDGVRLEKERQRTAGRVQQLQAHLTAMQLEQAALKKRLQEKLASQEKASADKAKEVAALRKAAEAAKRKVAELEAENRRQRAALISRTKEAMHAQHEALQAQRQLKKLSAQAAVQSSRQLSPCLHRAMHLRRGGLCSTSSRQASWRDAGHSTSSASSSRPLGASQAISVRSTLCSPRCSIGHVQQQHCSTLDHQQQQQQQDASSAESGSNNSSWFKHQLQILATAKSAEEMQQRLQARLEEVVIQRGQLISAKAQLDIKRLRRCCSTTNTAECSTAEEPDAFSAAEQCLLEGLTDQLDASQVEFEHLTQELQQHRQATMAAAHAAAADLRSKVAAASSAELSQMLQQAVETLLEQSSHLQGVMTKALKLELELAEQQQQLDEATCCLQSAQLQHHTQLADVQREHEQRLMAVLWQQQEQQAAVAAVAAAARSPPSLPFNNRALASTASSAAAVAVQVTAVYRGSAAAAAAALLGHQDSKHQQIAAKPLAAGIAAVFNAGSGTPLPSSPVDASFRQSGSCNGSSCEPVSNGGIESMSSRATVLSPRSAGPQLSDLLACLAQQSQSQNHCQQLLQLPSRQQGQPLKEEQQQEQSKTASEQQQQLNESQLDSERQQHEEEEGLRASSRTQSGWCASPAPFAHQHVVLLPEPEAEISFAGALAAGQAIRIDAATDGLDPQWSQHDRVEHQQIGPMCEYSVTAGELDQEASPSKLQAKLAAYKKYLKLASPQKAAAATAASSINSIHSVPVTTRRQHCSDAGPTKSETDGQQCDIRLSGLSDGGVVWQQDGRCPTATLAAQAKSTVVVAEVCSGDAVSLEDPSNAELATRLHARVRQSSLIAGQHTGLASYGKWAAPAGATGQPQCDAAAGLPASKDGNKSVSKTKPDEARPSRDRSSNSRTSMHEIREEIAAAGAQLLLSNSSAAV